MQFLQIAVVTLLLEVGCSAQLHDSDTADLVLCTTLRDHLVELRLAQATGIDLAAHREALIHALGTGFLDSCTATLTAQQARCASSAASLAAAEACRAAGQRASS